MIIRISKIALLCSVAMMGLANCDKAQEQVFQPGTAESDQFLQAVMGRNVNFGLTAMPLGVKIGDISTDPNKMAVYFTTIPVPPKITASTPGYNRISKLADKKMRYMYAISATEGFFEMKHKDTSLSITCKMDISAAPKVSVSIKGFNVPLPLILSP